MNSAALVVLAFATASLAAAAVPAARADDSPGHETCVEVRIRGDDQGYLSCLNQFLDSRVRGADKPAKIMNVPPVGAGSSSLAVGTFNQAATKQRMGNTFGKSAIPQARPRANQQGFQLRR